LRDSAAARADHNHVVRDVAQLLAAVGEQLRRGDHILAGSLTHVPVHGGDTIHAEIESIGAVDLIIAR
jgi:2-keto-4-pentenoate hydratase